MKIAETEMQEGKYSRSIEEFSKPDTYLVVKSLGAPVSQDTTRHENMKTILRTIPQFADNLEKTFYFKIYMYQEKKLML